MNQLLNIYKPTGLTPLQVIELVKKQFPEYKNEKIGYAGRLDPLAHGVLLLMVGEATKEREKYLNLPKTYEFEALFGVTTDTYDTLGIIEKIALPIIAPDKQTIKTFIESKLGRQRQTYPPYSSKAVNGKPLLWWAKNNKLSEITIPQREIAIETFTLQKLQKKTTHELQQTVFEQIDSVKGDFRQNEIKKTWEAFFLRTEQKEFFTAGFLLSCTSGTYVRSLVHELGETLKTGAITLEILRTKVGNYPLETAIKLV
jgi:tRNA pseudouridine55 synthase